MSLPRLLPILAYLSLHPAVAAAADLGKIERTIAREPTYQSKAPRYCLLVFGPDAQKRVWLVLDGDRLYVDRNSNGDLTEKGEQARFATKGPQLMTFAVAVATEIIDTYLVVDTEGRVDITWTAKEGNIQQRAYVQQWASRPQEAPVLHFNGPLTLHLSPLQLEQTGVLHATLGTQGLGPDTFVSHSLDKRRPDALSVVAEVEWPNRVPSGKPIRAKYSLKPDS